MGVSQPHHGAGNGTRPDSIPAGAPAAEPRLEDRSHLLRRTPRSLFVTEPQDGNGVRLRRERRVNATFRGIPALSRNGRH